MTSRHPVTRQSAHETEKSPAVPSEGLQSRGDQGQANIPRRAVGRHDRPGQRGAGESGPKNSGDRERECQMNNGEKRWQATFAASQRLLSARSVSVRLSPISAIDSDGQQLADAGPVITAIRDYLRSAPISIGAEPVLGVLSHIEFGVGAPYATVRWSEAAANPMNAWHRRGLHPCFVFRVSNAEVTLTIEPTGLSPQSGPAA